VGSIGIETGSLQPYWNRKFTALDRDHLSSFTRIVYLCYQYLRLPCCTSLELSSSRLKTWTSMFKFKSKSTTTAKNCN